MSRFRDALITISRKNYRKNLQILRDSLAPSKAVAIYEREYNRHLKSYQNVSSKSELIKRVLSSDLIFHGDYHTLRQSQRSVLRILREVARKRQVLLCLEMFHAADQKHVDAYLADKISEGQFIKKIDYRNKWPFSWRNWGAIVYFCKQNTIPILGINTRAPDGIRGLRYRDRFSARIIAKACIRYPDQLIYVVDGDFHVSPGHLPKEVDTLLGLLDVDAKRHIIYQNVENLYWKMCRQNEEEADVLKINDESFCIMNTIPANKVQSYLNWLEYAEDAYYPTHGEWAEDIGEPRGMTVQEMAQTIARVLDLAFPSRALDKLTVYYANDLYFMDYIFNLPGTKGKSHLIREKIKRAEGFLLTYEAESEKRYLIYLPNSNLNMAAEEASHFVNAVLSSPSVHRLSAFDRFYWNTITECLGFFGSKFINEKRKAHTESSLRRIVHQAKRNGRQTVDPETLQIARYLLQHYYLQRRTTDPSEFERKFGAVYRNRSIKPTVFSTQLGYMLGNKLYYAVKKGYFPLSDIRKYYCDPFSAPCSAFECYHEIIRRVGDLKQISQF